MHWRRWERLVAEYSEAATVAHVAFGKWVDQMDRQYGPMNSQALSGRGAGPPPGFLPAQPISR
jgi:hypothetical protein